ncbi:hypothetical protein PNOK_0168100 [Pyrrhoderma noxium]|uniref:N-acetyltransferase domain-containing protein n=1 Tax=Pyrrhoderma noxium TaxID=2282107 RepID=A0A286UQC7_9AGAM|nr:hypothetical protein PNOK_0168100 [Pyrrhoderma noxium]
MIDTGYVPTGERRLLVNSDINTVTQFYVLDYGMENCSIVISMPESTTDPGNSTKIAHNGSVVELDAWILDTHQKLDFAKLSWNSKPRRRAHLGVFSLQYGTTQQSPGFKCQSGSFQTIEISCHSENCSVDTNTKWEEKSEYDHIFVCLSFMIPMSSIVVKHLQHPTESQIDEAVKLCLRAYGEDPALIAMTGNQSDLRDTVFRSMIRAAVLEGSFYIASDGSDSIFSIAVWFGPGKALYKSEEQRKLGFNEFFEALSPETRHWWTEVYTKQLDKYLDDIIGKEKLLNSWYANNIATDPVHQGKGYGTALLKTIFEEARKDQSIVALGTQNEQNTEIPAPTGNFPAMFFTWGED